MASIKAMGLLAAAAFSFHGLGFVATALAFHGLGFGFAAATLALATFTFFRLGLGAGFVVCIFGAAAFAFHAFCATAFALHDLVIGRSDLVALMQTLHGKRVTRSLSHSSYADGGSEGEGQTGFSGVHVDLLFMFMSPKWAGAGSTAVTPLQQEREMILDQKPAGKN